MITQSKGKFVRSIAHIEIELGSKNSLMQVPPSNQNAGGKINNPATKESNFVEPKLTSTELVQDKIMIVERAMADADKDIKYVVRGKDYSPKEKEIAINSLTEQIKALLKSWVDLTKIKIDEVRKDETTDKQAAYTEKALKEQHKANSLAEKKIDMGVLDVNEMKGFSIVEKYGLLSPEKLQEFADKIKGGSAAITADIKALQTSLKKDGKYSGAIDGNLNDATLNSVGAFVSENAEAILKYVEVQKRLKGLSTGDLTPPSSSSVGRTEAVEIK